MAKYFVINSAKAWGKEIDAPTSFEARKIAAYETRGAVSDFFAIREDLMTTNDWLVWGRIKNK